MIRTHCPACNYHGIHRAFVKDGFEIVRCEECKSLFVKEVPTDEELQKIYDREDYYDLGEDSLRRICAEASRRGKMLRRWKRCGSLIEIGCARGLQLDAFQSAGFKTFGTELSQANVGLASERGHNVVHGGLDAARSIMPKSGFDVVACLDVIEHVPDPVGFLRNATELLADDGVMIVSTPNYSGLVARLLGARDPFMTPPEHLNFFSLSGMRHLFRQCGLQELKRVTFGTLTKEEINRTLPKYFPELAFLAPVINPLMPIGVFMLNLLKVGLEMEFYLVRDRR